MAAFACASPCCNGRKQRRCCWARHRLLRFELAGAPRCRTEEAFRADPSSRHSRSTFLLGDGRQDFESVVGGCTWDLRDGMSPRLQYAAYGHRSVALVRWCCRDPVSGSRPPGQDALRVCQHRFVLPSRRAAIAARLSRTTAALGGCPKPRTTALLALGRPRIQATAHRFVYPPKRVAPDAFDVGPESRHRVDHLL